jgi:hypothetical protein
VVLLQYTLLSSSVKPHLEFFCMETILADYL